MPEFDPRSPLKAYMRRQTQVDAEMRKALREAARAARAEIAKLEGKTNVGSRVRLLQLRLQEQQLRMWQRAGVIIEDGMSHAVDDVAELQTKFAQEQMARIGVPVNSQLARSMQATAQSTINNYLARAHHGMTLSQRVYKNGQVASGRIDRIINNALLQGKSARELAKDVYKFINPATPGGSSYAAMRLGRTELNNAFHESSKASASANPTVSKMEWLLSASHPKPDECDNLVGKYNVDDVPEKPHPQCFCYVTPVPMSHAELIRRMNRGEFDAWAGTSLAG